jgi:hypothetical protein
MNIKVLLAVAVVAVAVAAVAVVADIFSNIVFI